MSDSNAISVMILDKEFRVSCPPEEANALRNAAAFLDERMRDVRATGKVIGSDRVAVIAALNIAHELLQRETSDHESTLQVGSRIRALHERIDVALHESNQLEI